jgi:flagellar biosynthesis chaperone FliJ
MHNQQQTESKVREIVSLLRTYHKKLKGKKRVAQAATFAAIFLVTLFILVLFESNFYLSAWVKSLTLLILLAGSIIAVYRISKTVQTNSFKSFIEDFFTSRDQDEVLSAVDLYLDEKQKKSRFYSAAINANLKGIETDILRDGLKDYIGQTRVHQLSKFSLITSGVVTLFALIVAFSLPSESLRTLHFWNGYEQPNPFTFTITPADTTIEHGSEATVSIQYHNEYQPNESVLEFKTDVEENYRQRQMQKTENVLFQSSGIELTNDISYRVIMDDFVSEEYRIDVQLQPRFDQLTASVTPPSYTGLPVSEYEYPFSEISLYPGSELNFQGVTNKPVQFVRLNSVNDTLDLQRSDSANNEFSATFKPDETDTLTFAMTDEEGLQNRNPFRTILNIQQDQYPVIVIQEPTGTVMKTDPSELEIIFQATDDFGLTRSDLVWSHQQAFTEEPEAGSLRLSTPANGKVTRYQWNLEEFDLKPRDQLTFSLRVWDNDQIEGAKMSESQEVIVQIPSLTEYFDELDEQEQNVQGELEEVSREFENMENQYQEFLDKLRQNLEGGFEEQQMLEEVQERQQQIDETVKSLNEKFQQLRNEMEQSDRVSKETQQAYRELQQLMEELDDPALQEAMEELQRAMENLSP